MSPDPTATPTDGAVDSMEDSGSRDGPELDPLFVEQLAAAFYFDTLSKRLFNTKQYSPYLFFLAVFILDVPILSTIRYLRTGFHPLVANPVIIIVPIGYIYGIWAVRRIRRQYKENVLSTSLLQEDNQITDPTFNPSLSVFERIFFWLYDLIVDGPIRMDTTRRFESIVTSRFKIGLLFVGWGLHAAWILFTPGATEFIFQLEGQIIGPIKWLGIIPLALLLGFIWA